MRYDAMNEHYTEIRLFGKPALFNDMRLDQATVPKCTMYRLDQIFMVISHVWIIRFRNCQTRCYGGRTSWKTSRYS